MSRYKPYPEYKESGVNSLGMIPTHWSTSKLKFVTTCLDGKRVPLNASERGEMQGDIPYWGANSVVGYVRDWLFDDELVLLGEDGAPFFEPNRDVAFHVSGKIWPNNHVHVLMPNKKLFFAKYLTYCLNCVDYYLYITGSTRDKLNQSDMNNITLRMCDLHEQQKIAAFLDYETAKIDALIEKQHRLIELLKEKRQAVISHTVTKGLNPNAPMKDSGVEWLGEVPAHWNTQKLAWRFTAKKGANAAQLTKEFCATIEGEHPVYSGQTENSGVMASIDSYEFDAGEEGYLFSTTVGAKAMTVMHITGRFSLSQNCMVIIPCTAYSIPRFYYYHFQPLFSYERGLIPEHMQASFRMEDLYQYKVLEPPKSEQIEIANFLDVKTAVFDDLISRSLNACLLLQERRTALISAAVTGKIDVRDWQAAA
jgi:type I restriction enzyme S subunit